MSSSPATKDIYLSRDRDRIENMGLSARSDDNKPTLAKDSDVFVGFSDLPNQIHRKTVKKGFEFTLMVVGKCLTVSLFAYRITTFESNKLKTNN